MLTFRASSKLRSACLLWACLVLAICACFPPVAYTQSPNLLEALKPRQATASTSVRVPKIPLLEALNTRGDLALQEATIEKALFAIAASWNVNIVVGKDIEGSVSCIYKQAPLREVLDAILLANGYSYRAVGDSLVVQNSNDVGSANPLFESATIPVVHSNLDELVDGAQLLKSQQGEVRGLESANSILVVDYADRVKSIKDFVARMDAAAAKATGGIPAESYKRLTTAYFHTQYVPVENTREPIATVLSTEGRMGTMPFENRLIVTDYASNIAMVKKVLERIDRPLPQVRITALIYDISLQDVEQLGLNWNSVAKGRNLDANSDPQNAFTFDTTTLIPFSAGSAGGTATFRSLDRYFDLNAVALLLQNANDARLLANPNVTVIENKIAEMSSVQQIPFQQQTQSELGGQLATTAFKNVGITLNVTPRIAADGTIRMDVQQEFSRVAGFTENDNQPIVDTRIANTTVRVANRQTLVIGGMRQRSDTGDFNGIPFLKDVHLIGPLFRSRDTNVRESELLVFIMPEIVGYDLPASCREYLAQETVNCRLDRVPMAEGCQNPCGSSNCTEGSATDLIPLPAVDEVPATNPAAVQPHHHSTSEKNPFRPGFDQRYRAK